MNRPCGRLFASLLLFTLVGSASGLGCEGDDSSTSSPTAASGSGSASSATSDATDSATDSTSDSDSSGTDSGTGLPNDCENNAIGEWNACKMGALTDNSKCNWIDNGITAGEIACVKPSSGGGSVCSIRACETQCDCFAPPTSGTAPVVCAPILSGGVKGCALNCSGSVTCPDGMQCLSGYCYWPNE
ncbi:MAG TPA: hypothetical protein ENK31_09220 [Nannocystis exedens]|nr:hypothetical protein [Nannocystis exedens]